MLNFLARILKDQKGQTTLEWAVLTILIAMSLIVIGLAFANGFPPMFEALYAKIVDLANSIGI
ncbi:Flp family type IVb pilin [candidate division CSSED10-310 bacterium]|uniref:Flp family type IVb pilin n=1 Tax=candidate division CSSED10-310 bacterium TaxID=2855610 RepID=A0ABV6Z4C7_UNCC1